MKLQDDYAQIQATGAKLVVIDSEDGPTARTFAVRAAQASKDKQMAAFPFLYEANGPVLRSLGMWSDMMGMAWMGYLVIDKSGRVVATNQNLSEQPGASVQSVSEILKAIAKAQSLDAPPTVVPGT